MLFCSSPSLSLRTDASSPTDPWWPTLARVAVLRRFAEEVSITGSHLVEFANNEVVGSAPLDEGDLVMALLFRRASDAATSLGLIARADPSPGHLASPHSQVWSCTVVDRAGPAATGFWWRDNTLRAAGEASGVIVDLMLRIVDRSTPACAASTEVFWVADWLARIALATRMGADPLSVAQTQQLLDVDEPSASHLAQRWAGALTTQVNQYRWHDLRVAIMQGEVSSPLVPPRAAAWFDAGSFGRWCVSNELFAGGLEPLLPTLLTSSALKVVSETLSYVRASNIPGDNGGPTPQDSSELLP